MNNNKLKIQGTKARAIMPRAKNVDNAHGTPSTQNANPMFFSAHLKRHQYRNDSGQI